LKLNFKAINRDIIVWYWSKITLFHCQKKVHSWNCSCFCQSVSQSDYLSQFLGIFVVFVVCCFWMLKFAESLNLMIHFFLFVRNLKPPLKIVTLSLLYVDIKSKYEMHSSETRRRKNSRLISLANNSSSPSCHIHWS